MAPLDMVDHPYLDKAEEAARLVRLAGIPMTCRGRGGHTLMLQATVEAHDLLADQYPEVVVEWVQDRFEIWHMKFRLRFFKEYLDNEKNKRQSGGQDAVQEKRQK